MNPSPSSTRILVAALRTTGTDSRTCSILDIGAAWVSGAGEEDKPFSGECAAFEGAHQDDRTAELTGLAGYRLKDPLLKSEGELITEFTYWTGARMDPVILAGLRPSMIRSFLLAAAKRADHWPKAGARPQFHARILDVHSLFLAHQLKAGRPIPSRGFHHLEIFEAMGVRPSSYGMTATEAALCERELILKLL